MKLYLFIFIAFPFAFFSAFLSGPKYKVKSNMKIGDQEAIEIWNDCLKITTGGLK